MGGCASKAVVAAMDVSGRALVTLNISDHASCSKTRRAEKLMADQDTMAENTGKMHYIPYIGASYDSGFKHQLRLLLLGDSFYRDTWSSTAPQEAIKHNIEHGSYHFFNDLQRIVTGASPVSSGDRQAFWDKVAFTNMVQEPVATANTKPNKEQWKGAWAAFPEIIRCTKPDVIFVFSQRAWVMESHFESPFTGSAVMDLWPHIPSKNAAYLRDFSTREPGRHALSGCFDHPSYVQRTGQWNEWHKWANQLLDAAPGKLGRTGLILQA